MPALPSTQRNKMITWMLLGIAVLLAAAAMLIGLDDNFIGVLLAFLAAVAAVLAFAHPWRQAKPFLFLLLGGIAGFILFILLDILGSSGFISLEGAAFEIFANIYTMLAAAAFFIGIVGAVWMFIRNRQAQQ